MKDREEKTGLKLFNEIVEGKEVSPFNHFEPFDVPARPQWILDKAKLDCVSELIKPEGSPFQIGLLMTTAKNTFTLAATQTGKSIAHGVEAVIMASGVIPVSMRFDMGVDTGIKRLVNNENISRFGIQADGSCGNIIGVGKYPAEKIAPAGSQIWIGTFKEARDKFWAPKLRELIPQYLLSRKRGVDGFSEKHQTFYFANGSWISLLTYEQDYKRFEAKGAWMVILDEEPPDRRIFTGSLEHRVFLRMCFTPINSLSWSYYDLYLPITEGKSDFGFFSCTQYDSPYQDKTDIESRKKHYHDYEIKPKTWGIFAEMSGKPYYFFEATTKALKQYIPRHFFQTMYPTSEIDEPADILDATIVAARVMNGGGGDAWEIYEDYKGDGAYWLSADTARGSDDPDDASDKNVAYVRRLPVEEETDPKMVAALWSGERNVEFAWLCLYASAYYNYCLICPEIRGEDGKVFLTTIFGYPFIYEHVVIREKTRKPTKILGFDTTVNTRKPAFDLAGSWLYEHTEDSKIPHKPLLVEFQQCVSGKGGRPDHTKRGSTDCLVAFGISEYVRKYALRQIRNNRGRRGVMAPEENQCSLRALIEQRTQGETRRCLGTTRGLDERERQQRSVRKIFSAV